MSQGKVADYDAVVVGAGFGGIRSLWELRKLGLSVKCFEAGSDVGGAWYWNAYPGARTDSEAWVYNFNFSEEVREKLAYSERYPSQGTVQRYLSVIVDHYRLRELIQFDTRIQAAHYDDKQHLWAITSADGETTVCRYFVAATGPLSIGRDPPFPGYRNFKGESYLAAKWPKTPVDFRGKRIAVIGTGATGVQIVPILANVAKSLTVFQRTPNYVLPGRNYVIDNYQLESIKDRYDQIWARASDHPFGLDMETPAFRLDDVENEQQIRQILDAGWEAGGFHFQFETLGDLFTNQAANDVASEYLREKIRAVVHDQDVAELLCPRYPFLSKRPPCGHFYYEAFNRPNVKLVDISKDDIDIHETGVRTRSGAEYEVDMIIYAVGYDAATGALSEMDVRGVERRSVKELWSKSLSTFAGLLIPGFPNLFLVAGPHVPFGNMPVVIEKNVSWIGNAIAHMEQQKLKRVECCNSAVEAWKQHLNDAFRATLFADSAKANHAWFVGANIPGKPSDVLFYFGGVPTWQEWLDRERKHGWPSLQFSRTSGASSVRNDTLISKEGPFAPGTATVAS